MVDITSKVFSRKVGNHCRGMEYQAIQNVKCKLICLMKKLSELRIVNNEVVKLLMDLRVDKMSTDRKGLMSVDNADIHRNREIIDLLS